MTAPTVGRTWKLLAAVAVLVGVVIVMALRAPEILTITIVVLATLAVPLLVIGLVVGLSRRNRNQLTG